MAEPQVGSAPVSFVPLPVDALEATKQQFLTLFQAQTVKANTALTEKIKRALGADHLVGHLDMAHLRVMVDGDVATLTGHVAQAGNKARAETAARETPGVKTVVNQLVVDARIVIDVAQALGNDPQTQREQIQVNVQHGVVYLAGVVNQAAVRLAATRIAADIPQARGIVNLIQIAGSEPDPEAERFVQPLIESEIYATDGQVGRVQQVVINPQNRRVSAVVAQTRLALPQGVEWLHLPAEQMQPPHSMLIPISSIRCAPSGALFLNVNSSEAAHFTDFNAASFDPPAAAWQPPYPYHPSNILWTRSQTEENDR